MSLPVMDGWTAASTIKVIPDLASIPIIGLSAHAMEGDREKALENGCDVYLTKPIDEDLLLETVENLLGDFDK
jgi:CheY-like chemotaxis protein